jgi:hypothetical protein
MHSMANAYPRRESLLRALMSTEREIASVKSELDNKQRLLTSLQETVLPLRAKVDQLRFEIGNVVASGK